MFLLLFLNNDPLLLHSVVFYYPVL